MPHIDQREKELREQFLLFVVVLCEKLWAARNGAFHGGVITNPDYLLRMIIGVCDDS